MARTVKDAKLDSRNARDKLPARDKPYYKMLIPGVLHLGYRRRHKGKGAQGRWLVRRYVGLDVAGVGRYRSKEIGLADDFEDADGVYFLNYAQAQARALEWRPDGREGQAALSGPLTVRAAIDRYLAALEAAGRPTADARLRADLHILPTLGSEYVEEMTTDRLRRWLADMAKLPPHTRQKAGVAAPRYRTAPADGETQRRRRSTANRVLTILKAALNHAFDEGHVKSSTAWGRRLKPFRKVEAARTRYLTLTEAKRLINASQPPAFRALVQAALQTGARFGELAALTVADFNPDAGTVAIQPSKSGKARHVHLTDEGAAFFEQLCAGRAGSEAMLRKPDGMPWQKSEQSRPMAVAVERGKISPRISFHGLRHSYASLSVMNGVPLHVVARNLGHADTRMVEKHYGHLSESYLRQAIREGAPKFGLPRGGKVVAL